MKSKKHGDLAFRENILLFYLKGEVQKLEPILNEEQKAAFYRIIEKMNTVIRLANYSDRISGVGYTDLSSDTQIITSLLQKEMAESMREIYSKLMSVREELGAYGSAVEFIAEELKHCSIYRCITESEENSWL